MHSRLTGLGRIVTLVLALAVSAGAAQADKLLWGYNAAPKPPWTHRTPDGVWSGFDVDIMNALCAEMQAECEIVPVAWDGIIPALQANKIDIIWSGMSMTAPREEMVDFTQRYRRGPAAFVAEKRLSVEITAESLQGKSIGVVKATNFYNYIEHYYGKAASIKLYDTLDDGQADLQAGRIDILMGDILELQKWMATIPGDPFEIKGVTPVDPILGRGAGAGVRKGDHTLRDRINVAIDAIRARGEYQEIAARYFTHDPYGSD